jgi:hypothetical protein
MPEFLLHVYENGSESSSGNNLIRRAASAHGPKDGELAPPDPMFVAATDKHLWISQPQTAARKGQWAFTQAVGGAPYKSASSRRNTGQSVDSIVETTLR